MKKENPLFLSYALLEEFKFEAWKTSFFGVKQLVQKTYDFHLKTAYTSGLIAAD